MAPGLQVLNGETGRKHPQAAQKLPKASLASQASRTEAWERHFSGAEGKARPNSQQTARKSKGAATPEPTKTSLKVNKL